jgi:hypothetical protein
MFELNGRHYKIEYEGLHMLCRTCGKFGHYLEGCPEREKTQPVMIQQAPDQRTGERDKGNESEKNNQDHPPGHWVVVQKPRRPRRSNASLSGGAGGNAGNSKMTGASDAGTRFGILSSINEEENNQENDRQTINTVNPPQHVKYNKGQKGKNQSNPTSAAKNINDDTLNKEKVNVFNKEPIIIIQEANRENNGGNHEEINANKRIAGADIEPTKGDDMDMIVVEKVNTSQQDNNTTDFGQQQGTRPPDKYYMGSNPLGQNIGQPQTQSSPRPMDTNTSDGTQEIVNETPAPNQSAEGRGDMIVD